MGAKKIPVGGSQQPLQSPFDGLTIQAPVTEAPATATHHEEVPRVRKPHRVILRREKAGRSGKTVTIVSQLPTHLSPPELETLCRDLRKSLGCGGSVHEREIEMQGEQSDRLRSYLEAHGYRVAGP